MSGKEGDDHTQRSSVPCAARSVAASVSIILATDRRGERRRWRQGLAPYSAPAGGRKATSSDPLCGDSSCDDLLGRVSPTCAHVRARS